MILQTTRFGEIELEEQDILQFPDGIPGFEQMRGFTLILYEEHEPFSYLQSVDDGKLAFIIIDPFEYYPDYDFHLPEHAVKEMEIENPEQIVIRTIVTIRDDLDSATTNLAAPIVIHAKARIGKQVILTNTEYTTRHRLFPSVIEK